MHKTVIRIKENRTGAAVAVPGVLYQPKTNFNNKGIKWYEDKKKGDKKQ